MNHTESIAFTIYLSLLVLGVQTVMVDIYEFVLFKDYNNTNRFKRTYRKRPFLKRFFLLTVFDNELTDVCVRKKLLKKIFVSDIFYWIIGLTMIISKIYLIINGNEHNIVYLCYSLILIIFYLWYLKHSIRWDKWKKGQWKAGQREFQITLPDERNKYKKK